MGLDFKHKVKIIPTIPIVDGAAPVSINTPIICSVSVVLQVILSDLTYLYGQSSVVLMMF